MACRKAADRAMMELSGWMEKQREEADDNLNQFLNEQSQIWTPYHVFEQCCVKWLADGWGDSTNMMLSQEVNARSGCSGGCGKSHPRITFDWKQQQELGDEKSSSDVQIQSNKPDSTKRPAITTTTSTSTGYYAVAILSHPLDPFVNYFDKLCEDGLASKEKDQDNSTTDANKNSCCTTYRLNGFLQFHLDRLKEKGAWGSHLLKVSPRAISASQRAHERQVEHEELEERDAKRRRRMNAVSGNESSADKSDLLERALTICCNYQLLHHIDLAEIGWMRLCGNPIMMNIAATMAATRLKEVRLSYSVLVDGMVRFHPGHLRRNYNNNNENVVEREGWIYKDNEIVGDPYGRGGLGYRKVEIYNVRASYVSLVSSSLNSFGSSSTAAAAATATTSSSSSSTSPDRFVPKNDEHNTNNNEYQWCSIPLLDLDVNPSQHTHLVPNEDYEFDYKGHIIRLYLEGIGGGSDPPPPESECLFSEPLEVARYHIDPRGLKEGLHKTPKLTYEVSSSEERIVPDSTTNNRRKIRYSGSFRIKEIRFDFGDLLGVYVRKKLPQAKLKMQQIRNKQRPVSRSEKEYVKALAKAARDAPGSATAFQGMKGW